MDVCVADVFSVVEEMDEEVEVDGRGRTVMEAVVVVVLEAVVWLLVALRVMLVTMVLLVLLVLLLLWGRVVSEA